MPSPFELTDGQKLARELTSRPNPELNAALLWALLSELNPKTHYHFADVLKTWLTLDARILASHGQALQVLKQLKTSYNFSAMGLADLLAVAEEAANALAQTNQLPPEFYQLISQTILTAFAQVGDDRRSA